MPLPIPLETLRNKAQYLCNAGHGDSLIELPPGFEFESGSNTVSAAEFMKITTAEINRLWEVALQRCEQEQAKHGAEHGDEDDEWEEEEEEEEDEWEEEDEDDEWEEEEEEEEDEDEWEEEDDE